MEVGDSVFSFVYKGRVHIFSRKSNFHSEWINEPINNWVSDTMNSKYCSFIIPLTDEKYHQFRSIQSEYCCNNPYDYAFFGMRCASATYDVLSEIGVLKEMPHFGMVTKVFYPKLLRKRFFRMAHSEGWELVRHEGNPRRKWEKR